MLEEIKSLVGHKVKRIGKDKAGDIYIDFYSNILFASSHPIFCRICFLSDKKKKALVKHPFEDFLKYHKVIEIQQIGLDRIFYIGFSKHKYNIQYYLVFEITGPSSNIYLLDSVKRIVFQLKSRAKKRIGETYCLTHKQDITAKKALKTISEAGSPVAVLEQRFRKLPPWIKQMEEMGGKSEIAEFLSKVVNKAEAYIVFKNDNPIFISPVKSFDSSRREKSFSDAVSQYYKHLIAEEKREQLSRKICNEIKAKKNILKKLSEEFENVRASGEFKIRGELILVNLGKIKRGESLLKLKDPYKETGIIEIKMDPKKSAVKNADEYFKRYRKAQRSQKVIKKREQVIKKEIRESEELMQEIANFDVSKLIEFEERYSFGEHGKRRKVGIKKEFRTFHTKTGKTVLVGRNKIENERLTFKVAKGKDIFFHVRESPGSHTILVNDGKLTKTDIEETAGIAAHFSKAKHSKIVPVSYTERKYVRKSKKLGPGKVLLIREKTIFVEPSIP